MSKTYSDKIQCEICEGYYTRSNRSTHNRTKKHIQAEKFSKKMKETFDKKIPDKKAILERANYRYYDIEGNTVRLTEDQYKTYNALSEAKTGIPMYYKTLKERDNILKQYRDDTESETEESETEESEIEEYITIPNTFMDKLMDKRISREQLRNAILIYNKQHNEMKENTLRNMLMRRNIQ